MRHLALYLSIAALGLPCSALAQAAESGTQTAKPVTQGPKVHVSEAEDVTGCANSSGGPIASAGIAAGGYLGSKVGGSSNGVMYGAMAGQVAGDHLSRKQRCDPRAKVEEGAAQTEEPKKEKKSRWGSLKKALEL